MNADRRRFVFSKYHGAGNDFVIVDARSTLPLPLRSPSAPTPPLPLWERGPGGEGFPSLAQRLCDRHFGIGADGLLIAEPTGTSGDAASIRMRMYNPDGSEAEMCGNGLRCFVRWLFDRGEIGPGPVTVQTGAGPLTAKVGSGGTVAVDMGAPRLAPAAIPLSAEVAGRFAPTGPVLHLALTFSEVQAPKSEVHRLRLDPGSIAGAEGEGEGLPPAVGHWTPGLALEATCVSMGNPHTVLFVPDIDAFPLEALGPSLERHPYFPNRTNVEICQVISRSHLRIRVWERGAGPTLACGTGACAAMVAAKLHGYVDSSVDLDLPGGRLHAGWPGDAADPRHGVILRGPVEHTFDGVWLMG